MADAHMSPLPDLWFLYTLMLKSRLFEEAIAGLWHDGLISGEMHLGTGEEAVIAGVVSQLQDGDSLALDHRGTAAMLMRGIDPVLILRELLGCSDGLCHGMGGHMHLFSKPHLAASSGIVGAAGPTAAGFALAAQYQKTGAVSVAFFGEGAMNQGMLLESFNLAAAWNLPVLLVCKDDGWAITTQSDNLTGGDLDTRARGLGVPPVVVDGGDVTQVWQAAHAAIDRARQGAGPSFLHARCVHFEGHFLGFQLLRAVRQPVKEMPQIGLPLARSLIQPGSSTAVRQRLDGLKQVLAVMLATLRDPRQDAHDDPLLRARQSLADDPDRLRALEDGVRHEIDQILTAALVDIPS